MFGFPTRMDKELIIVSNSCCNNYRVGLAQMEEFINDNEPGEPDPQTSVVGVSTKLLAASDAV